MPCRKKAFLERKAQFIRFSGLKLLKADRDIIHQLICELSFVNALKEATAKSIEDLVNTTPLIKRYVDKIEAISGVSTRFAAVIVAEVDDIKRFPTVSKFLLYSGNAIASDASGESVAKPHMTKRCNRHLRLAFRSAGQNVCERVKEDSDIKQYATKQMIKHNKAKKLAYANTGAKIARIVYALLRNDVLYEPLHVLTQERRPAHHGNQPMQELETFALKEIKCRARRFKNYIKRARENLPPGNFKVLYEMIHDFWNEMT